MLLDPGNVGVDNSNECLSPIFAKQRQNWRISVMATSIRPLYMVKYALESGCDDFIVMLDPDNVGIATLNEFLAALLAKLLQI